MRHAVVALALGATLAASAPGLAQVQPAPPPPAPEPIRMEVREAEVTNAPLPIASEDDVYCSGWLGELAEPFHGTVVGAEFQDNKTIYMETDVLYIDIGTEQGASPGQEYTIVRPNRVVYQYSSVLDELGRIYDTPGRLRILCSQENSSIAEIVRSCLDVEVGDRILYFEPIPIPLVRRTRPLNFCDPPNGKLLGHIVDTKQSAVLSAQGSIVFLDIGEAHGLSSGDVLTVYRQRFGHPVRTVLGEVSILTAKANASVAIVTRLSDTIYLGDEVELK